MVSHSVRWGEIRAGRPEIPILSRHGISNRVPTYCGISATHIAGQVPVEVNFALTYLLALASFVG